MENEKYTIVLADGTTLKNLTRNGDNYISTTQVDAAIFDGNCSPLTITGGEFGEEVHEYAECIKCKYTTGGWWMVFRDLSPAQVREAKLRADIDYLAMMTDTDMEG